MRTVVQASTLREQDSTFRHMMRTVLPLTWLQARGSSLDTKHKKQSCVQQLKNGSPNFENGRKDKEDTSEHIDITYSQNKVIPEFKISENDVNADNF